MSASKSGIAFELKRFLDFLRVFRSKKRAMLGVGIIVAYSLMAVCASLLTPYNPTSDVNLAGYRAAPAWLKYFPGYTQLNENMEIIADPGFSTPDSINQWTMTTSEDVIHERYSSVLGSHWGSGPGSLGIVYRRDEVGSTYGEVKVVLTKSFDFASTGAPAKFSGDITLFVQGTGIDTIDGTAYLDVPLKINVFIKTGNQTYNLWPPLPPDNPPSIQKGGFEVATADWVSAKASPYSPISSIDSTYYALKIKMYNKTGTTLDPTLTVFNTTRGLPASYIYGVELTFEDLAHPDRRVETAVYLDDMQFKTWGTAWGLLGTDQVGRDIFSQLVFGSRLSLEIGLLSTILGVVLGLVVGLAAGYLGRIADELMMRFTDALLIIPGLPLLVVIVSVLGPSMFNLILILGFLGWMGFARLVRSQVLSLRERPFVEAAKSLGAGRIHIISRHILPNVMSLVWITLATSVPGNIVAEAALSWLGFYDPNVMSWGRMLYDVQSTAGAIANWWWIFPPGLSIAAIALAFILVGFALDEVLNPKLRERR